LKSKYLLVTTLFCLVFFVFQLNSADNTSDVKSKKVTTQKKTTPAVNKKTTVTTPNKTVVNKEPTSDINIVSEKKEIVEPKKENIADDSAKITSDLTTDVKKSKMSSDSRKIREQQKKEIGKKINEEIKRITIENNTLKKQLSDNEKQIKTINESLIKVLDNEQIKIIQNQKNDVLYKQIALKQKIKENNINIFKLKDSLVKLKDKSELADGTLNWTKTYDISNKSVYKPGKWNITVKAIDNDKNESKEEAINITIDPKIDIPYINIINPTPNMRVPGNLKIVGTAFDNEAVGNIILYVDKETEKRDCIGKDFWSYDLDTSGMKDGVHSLRLKVFDAKGVSSKDYNIKFQLDRKTPFVEIKTMQSGAIVSGVLNIGGDAGDENGIVKVEYSTDNRQSFSMIPSIKYLNSERTKTSWNVKIDSKNLVEGIQTIWIKATDKTGSIGFSPLTVTIEDAKPSIRFDYPKDKSVVGSVFNVLGYAKDRIKLKSVSFAIESSGATKFEDVKLIPGDPFWNYPVNLSKLKAGKYKLTAKATNVAGNVQVNSINITYDPEKNKPVIKLKSMKKDERVSTSLQLFGTIESQEIIKSLSVKINKEGENTASYEDNLIVSPNFSLNIDLSNESKFSEGKYFVELMATDENGVESHPVKEIFWIDKTYPHFDDETIQKWAGKTFSDKIDLPVTINKQGGLKTVKYSIINLKDRTVLVEPKELKFREGKTSGKYDTDSIKEDFAKEKDSEKYIGVKLEAIDFLNNNSSILVPIVLDPISPLITELKIDPKAGMVEDATIDISDNFKLRSVVIDIVSSKKTTEKITVTEEELKSDYHKEIVFNVKDSDGKSNLDYTFTLTAKDISGNETKKSYKVFFKEGKADSYKVNLSILTYKMLSNLQDPDILMDSKDVGLDNIDSTIYVLIPPTYKDVFIKYNNRKLKTSEINAEIGAYILKFSDEERKSINSPKISADIVGITSAGVENKLKTINIYSDNSAPEGNIIWPPSYTYFNDTISVYGIASDDSNEFSVSYSVDSESDFKDLAFSNIGILKTDKVVELDPFRRINKITVQEYMDKNKIILDKNDSLFKVDLPLKDAANGEHYVIFKIKDKSGKELIKKCVVIYDNKAPEINVWNPKDDEILNGQTSIRGDVKDDFKMAGVVIIHNGEEKPALGKSFWDGVYNLTDIKGIDYKKEEQKLHKIDLFALDFAGNKSVISKNIKIDVSSDVPTIFINSPAVPEQRFTDLIEFGGVAIDNTGIEYVQYRVDAEVNPKTGEVVNGVKWERIDMQQDNPNWNKKLSSDSLKPGRHFLEVQAINLLGVKSKIERIPFHLALENPIIVIQNPTNGTYIKGETAISGKATSPNGIDYVEVSTNYGWTFIRAEGKEFWKYYLASGSVPDGALRFLVRTKDLAGSEAFSFELYNVDNKAPEIDILTPRDGDSISNIYRVIGRAKDNIGLDWVKVYVNSQDSKRTVQEMDEFFVDVKGTKEAWYYDIDARNFDTSKKYQIIARAKDFAGNITERSIDFYVDPLSDLPTVQLDQPQSEQHITGESVDIYGTAEDHDGIEAVYVKIDDQEQVKANGTKVWNYSIPSTNMTPGIHKVMVMSQKISKDGNPGKFSGPIIRIFYIDESGPVIDITSHISGEAMEHRPWLSGKATYYEKDIELKMKRQIQQRKLKDLTMKFRKSPEKIPSIDTIAVTTSEVESAKRKYLADNAVKEVFMSLDNGKTFERQLGPVNNWKIRVQTQNFKNGTHMIQFKAVTRSGKETLKYFKVKIDRVKPTVQIDVPVENDKLTDKLVVRGTATDNGNVEQVKISFNQFDKNLGKIPKFIEGLYIWVQGFGGPWVSGGFGLTFFEDIVRLEGLFGWSATRSNLADMGVDVNNGTPTFLRQNYDNPRYQPRFSGYTTGGKLLARVIDIPFEFFFGEDAKNFSISVEIGAGFFWFSGFAGSQAEIDNSYYQKEKSRNYNSLKDGKIVAGFMYQVDLFKVERYGILRKFAIYFENAFYFIASEYEGGLFPQIGFGIRNAFF
jgi:hypothetical protein